MATNTELSAMVQDASLRDAPHHEAFETPRLRPAGYGGLLRMKTVSAGGGNTGGQLGKAKTPAGVCQAGAIRNFRFSEYTTDCKSTSRRSKFFTAT